MSKVYCGRRNIPDGNCSYVCGQPREGVPEEPLQCTSCEKEELKQQLAEVAIPACPICRGVGYHKMDCQNAAYVQNLEQQLVRQEAYYTEDRKRIANLEHKCEKYHVGTVEMKIRIADLVLERVTLREAAQAVVDAHEPKHKGSVEWRLAAVLKEQGNERSKLRVS